MITIHLVYDENHEPIGFRSEGHAGYAAYGKDIICSAVSTLSINTINSIERITVQDVIYEISEDAGLLRMKFAGKVCPEAKLLFESYSLGVRQIEEDYGRRYLKVIEVMRVSNKDYKIIDHQEV